MNCERSLGGLRLAVFLVLALWVTGSLGAQGGDGLKIAVIDVQKILTHSEKGKATIAKFEELAKTKEAELTAQRDRLTELRKRYQESRLSLAEEKLAEMEAEVEDATIALRRNQEEAQRQLQKRQQEDFGEIEKAVLPIISQLGEEYGYSLIFNKFQSGLVYADKTVDVTDLVIERFDSANASGH